MAKLFCGNLPFDADADALRAFFDENEINGVQGVTVVYDRDTGASRGFAFVIIDDKNEFAAALDLDGRYLGTRALTINEARSKPRSDSGPQRPLGAKRY